MTAEAPQKPQFWRSGPMVCPYLPDREERRLVTFLVPETARNMFDTLSRAGFRRSHHMMYRPVCPACSACIPVRIPVDGFVAGRSWRRVLKRNASLQVLDNPPVPTDEQYALFIRYQAARHRDSGMAGMTRTDYDQMLTPGPVRTRILEARDAEGILRGVMVFDCLQDGFSAVYSFFDPDLARRSPGTFLILSLVLKARAENLPCVYLGYQVDGSPGMDYKSRFRPLEKLGFQGWEPF
ncbi:MAG: arginyltransferase [Pseudomonadota bacterium]|nr:arginyltransferase [Pseudomonadota bacterium]